MARGPREGREAKARKLARRKWEARVRVSLSKRHDQYVQQRADDLLAQKIRERQFRGKKMSKAQKRAHLRFVR